MIKKLIFITLLGISFLAGSVLAAPADVFSNSNCYLWIDFDDFSSFNFDANWNDANGMTSACSSSLPSVAPEIYERYMRNLEASTANTIDAWNSQIHTVNLEADAGVFNHGARGFGTNSYNKDMVIYSDDFVGGNWTMSFWGRFDLDTIQTGASGHANTIILDWGGDDYGSADAKDTMNIRFYTNNKRFEAHGMLGSSQLTLGSSTLLGYSDNNVITDENWHFIVINFDDVNNEWAFYVDGQDVTASADTSVSSSPTHYSWHMYERNNFADVMFGHGCATFDASDAKINKCATGGYTGTPLIQADDLAFWTADFTQDDLTKFYNEGVGRRLLELSSGADDAIDLDQGLEMYYDVDGVSANTQNDMTNNGHTLTLANTPGQVTGVINYARELDGSSMYGSMYNVSRNIGAISNGFGATLAPGGSDVWAWQFWAKPDNPSSTDTVIGWYRPPQSNNNAIGVEALQCRNGEWNLFYRWEYGTGVHGDGGPSCDSGTWQHMVWVWDGINYKIYKNGELTRSFHKDNYPSWGVNPPYTSCVTGGSTADLEIGIGLGANLNCDSGAHYDYFDGSIDEVGLWYDSTDWLNHHEVECLYNDGLGYSYGAITTASDCTGTGDEGTSQTNGIVSNTGIVYHWTTGYPTGVTGSITYNNTNNLFNYTWNDTQNGADYGQLRIQIYNRTQWQTVSTQSGGSHSGSLTYNASAYVNYTMKADGFISDSSRTYVNNGLIWVDTLQIGTVGQLDGQDFGDDGVFWSAIIIGTFMLFGIWSPPVALGLGVFGLFIVSTLGILDMGGTALWSIVLMAIILMWKIRS